MNTAPPIPTLIRQGESLTLEFKSDAKRLPDRELIAAIVGLANTEGGDLLLGVEDDGTVTGLHPLHRDMPGLVALVANRTSPPLTVKVEEHEVQGHVLARIMVPKSRRLIATSEGQLLRRKLKADGTPEAVPLYPHEFVPRLAALGQTDPSAMLFEDIDPERLDLLQLRRLRDAIDRYGGDPALRPLSDRELIGALDLIREAPDGRARPTLTGLLLLGTEALLREHLPAHEIAFQVLSGGVVRVNEFYRKPLLETYEIVETQFKAWVVEDEMDVGMFRVPIPNYDRLAFREAFVNALVHRDYGRLGAIHVKMDSRGLDISNPGGFVDGVRPDNLLVVAPRSRNAHLADVIKRVGLAERTGRGIDRIYAGMLRYGRPAPSYALSNDATVHLFLAAAAADRAFLRMVVEHYEKLGAEVTPPLIVLARLREERRLTAAALAPALQQGEAETRAVIEMLLEAGLIEASGGGRSRSYILSAAVYRAEGRPAAYVRQAGFSAIQQEQMVLQYVDAHGNISRADTADLCHLSDSQAYRLLNKLIARGILQRQGINTQTVYARAEREEP